MADQPNLQIKNKKVGKTLQACTEAKQDKIYSFWLSEKIFI